jgi:hypothetical protein
MRELMNVLGALNTLVQELRKITRTIRHGGLVRLDFFLPREGSNQKGCQRKLAAW